MKNFYNITAITLIIFAVISLATAKIERHFDGNDTYGYPWTFHTKYSGMCDPCPDGLSYTNYFNLAMDVGFALVIGIMVMVIIRRLIFRRT